MSFFELLFPQLDSFPGDSRSVGLRTIEDKKRNLPLRNNATHGDDRF